MKPTTEPLQHLKISRLGAETGFADIVANRIWEAWWKERGYPITYISNLVKECLDSKSIPIALVAHIGATFVGTVSVIVSDMPERPSYTPWIAALWVDPEYRQRSVGETLIEAAFKSTLDLGHKVAYLCATCERRAFYLKRGWHQIEEGIGEKSLTIMIRE
jgi:GNAT superfamily N-acetyltransferase